MKWIRTKLSSCDRWAYRYLPVKTPCRESFVTLFLAVISSAGILLTILRQIHLKTYVWQSTEMASALLLRADRSSCWLTPPSLNEVKQMKGIDFGRSRMKIGMLMMYDTGQQMVDEWDKDLMLGVVENKLKYAKKHGYTPILANHMIKTDRPSAWSKLRAMKHYLPHYDYLMYVDMDTVIMDLEVKLESFIAAAGPCADIIMSEDWSGPNSGIWITKNSKWSQWFLEHAWEVGKPLLAKKSKIGGTAHPFQYEQRVFHYLLESKVWKDRKLPRYPGGRGITPVATSHNAISQMRSHISMLPQCAFNSYCLHPLDTRELPSDRSRYVEGDFMIHFAGKKGDIKTGLIRHYLAKAKTANTSNINRILLENELLEHPDLKSTSKR